MTKAAQTRQWIIEQAAPIFNTKGVSATAMSDIMEATKLSKGSLYVHFEDKEALACAVVDHNLQLLLSKTQAALQQHTTAKGKLVAFIDFLTDPVNPPVPGGCPIMNFGLEADDTNPVILAKVDLVVKKVLKNLAGLIEQGIRAGEFKISWDAKAFATKTFAMIEGGVLIARVSRKKEHLKQIVDMLKQEISENSV